MLTRLRRDRNLTKGTIGGPEWVALCNRSRIDPGTLIASTAEIYLEDRMEPPEEAAEGETPEEAAEEGGASQDPPDHDIPSRTRYAGSVYGPELNTTYRIVEEGGAGLTLHVGRLDPATLLAESDGCSRASAG